jgi:hypothetical protein
VDTVKAFCRALDDGNVFKARKYAGGDFSPDHIQRMCQRPKGSGKAMEAFFNNGTFTLREETGDTANVRWEMDYEAMTEGIDFSYMGEIGAQLEKIMKALSIVDFYLEKFSGRWKIVGCGFPNAGGFC